MSRSGGTYRFRLQQFLRDFDWAVESFNKRGGRRSENFARGTALYFHDRLMELLRGRGGFPSAWIKNDRYFAELLYAMLASWGMDRQNARLVEFTAFTRAVVEVGGSEVFRQLEGRRVREVDETWQPLLRQLWRLLSSRGKIMVGRSILVGSSKLLHHLLPDLFGPIDRSYTLDFLNHLDAKEPWRISTVETMAPGFEAFYKATLLYAHISRSVSNIETYLHKGPMSGSVPKVIDNAVMAWWGAE